MRNFFVYKILVLTLLALCCVCFKAYAGFETIADTVEVTPGNRSLIVMASYSGDDDANNSLQVEWGENGEDFSLGSQVLPHRESPYAYSIEDLDVRKSYQVRVTYLDDNEPDPDATLLAQVPNNPLVHNSISTGSDKWDGAWGVEDGKYGKFGCGACHKSNSGNIKRVRKMLTAPNGSDQFPIEADGFEVIFSSAAEGASDFGDDENGHATSQKICESCHTITNFHRYDTGAQASLSHYNRSDCMDCHKHNNGFAHGQGSGSGCGDCHGVDGGAGTVVSHSTHTEGDLDDQRGPQLACDYCHESDKFPNFNSGVDLNGDNKIDLSETDVCDACHSAQGSYDGVNDLILGAKANWDDGVYDGAALKAGKEKWCATCHDESPSIIDSIAAPNVIGDEDGAYTYSTVSPGYGYYKTGHGLSTDESYPASGGVVSGGGLECDACHDYSSVHTDSLARTFDCSDGCDADEYRSSYRLLQVGGENPMQIPWTGGGLDGSSFRLCSQTSCHPSGPFTDSANPNTNLKSWATVEVEPGVWEDRWTNRHVYHLGNVFSKVPADYDPVRFSELSWNSRMVCVTCHNVHGSTQLAMVRDGKLIDREPGLPIWYSNDLLTSTETTPPQPADLPLSASNGSVWTPKTAGNLCSGCHGGNPLTTISREPFQDLNQAPRLAWVGGAGYSSDGVNPDNGPGSSSFYFQVNYSDDNNHLPLAIEVWIDRNDDGDYLDLDEKLALTPAAAADINVMDGKVYERIVTLDK
ncbi:MAG: hypothetical protein OET90_07370, partial [Desulfuromonadales bacterium]|nr:hypothetical protein [Desulfuromonadales bacterium]